MLINIVAPAKYRNILVPYKYINMNTDSNQVIPTHFEHFDRFLNGGLPVGKLTFLAGHSVIGVT